jgi:hypothetical protein
VSADCPSGENIRRGQHSEPWCREFRASAPGIIWPAACHGLLSRAHLENPDFQWNEQLGVEFLLLIPITKAERYFVIEHGYEKLESLFERESLDYRDPFRASLVPGNDCAGENQRR